MIKRLEQSDWSSYRTYTYNDSNLILSKVSGADQHQVYPEKFQRYSGEEQKMSENNHLGIIAGTKKFAIFIINKKIFMYNELI